SLRASNCTFTGNSAIQGTAIFGTGAITIDNCTIFGNGSGNTVVHTASTATVRVRNTIIAGNLAGQGEVAGTFISEGYNLIGTQASGTTGFGATGDQLGVTAAQVKLGSLEDNGGMTPTRMPLPGSLAIDQGKRGVDLNNQPIKTDQRGKPRPVDQPNVNNAPGGDASDVGAVETGLAQTGPFTVTHTAEHQDGVCSEDDCTLLDAINAANANADASVINFVPGMSGIITTHQLTPGGIPISESVTINGPGARNLMISAQYAGRVFYVSGSEVAISGLTVAAARYNFSGGAIYHFNGGTLTLSDCTMTDNATTASNGDGGGIFNAAGSTLVLERCTFYLNEAPQFGGGVYSDGVFTATNSTFSANYALRGGGVISRFNGGAARMTLRNCTITGNTARDGVASPGFGGGGVFAEGNSTQYFAANNLIAGNFATNDPDIRGNYTSQGNNLIGKIGDASGFANGVNGDKVGTVAAPLNAQFGSLGSNGGPTDTWSLLASSPAINSGNNALAPVTDQRGFGRNGVSDIGAYEFNGPPPPVSLAGAVSRKTHGASGTFDIGLALTGTPTVECRRANGDYRIIFTFTNRIATVGSTVVTSGTGFVSSSEIGVDARQYVVNLSGIANAQRVTVTLFNVTDGLGYNSSSVPVAMGVLSGDSTGDGSVSASDISQTKGQSGQPVSASNFRSDVNGNGAITASDIAQVKAQSGTQLSP
ncbi:MAG TPA: choice-of-anchor Q domain-containing protein, partial [Chthoniobacterales bacterium]|nr:choice-of-anchor Q domain-containing protein [Chthoniobacterales bacterium]